MYDYCGLFVIDIVFRKNPEDEPPKSENSNPLHRGILKKLSTIY
tara:strand:- start:815 stop:946 length:132 start_codon:yes stop_codon:yes gene_type:complete